MSKWKMVLIAAAASALTAGGVAKATTLGTLSILGSTTANGTYSSSLSVTPGEQVYVEVTGQLNQGGTNGTKTISSLSATADGISSLGFNLTQTDSTATLGSAVLASSSTTPATAGFNWAAGPGATAGTINSAGVNAVRPIGIGVDNATATGNDVIWEGLLTVGTASTNVSGIWNSAASGGFKINGGSNVLIIGATEATAETNNSSTADFSWNALSLSQAASPVPAPSVVGGSVLAAGLGLTQLVRRRQMAL